MSVQRFTREQTPAHLWMSAPCPTCGGPCVVQEVSSEGGVKMLCEQGHDIAALLLAQDAMSDRTRFCGVCEGWFPPEDFDALNRHMAHVWPESAAAPSSGTPHDELPGEPSDEAVREASNSYAVAIAERLTTGDVVIRGTDRHVFMRAALRAAYQVDGAASRSASLSVPGDPQERLTEEERDAIAWAADGLEHAQDDALGQHDAEDQAKIATLRRLSTENPSFGRGDRTP